MNRIDLYKKTVDILYQAYFNDTLKHSSCYSCAVGNIVANNMNYSFGRDGSGDIESLFWVDKNNDKLPYPSGEGDYIQGWGAVFCTDFFGNAINPENYKGSAKEQIDSTGYSWQELSRVEAAFESANKQNETEEEMFNGLVAVLEALKQIHEITDESLIQANHTRFADHHKKLTITQ